MDTNEDEDEKDDEAQKKAAEFQYQAWLKWLFSGHEIALEILKTERANMP